MSTEFNSLLEVGLPRDTLSVTLGGLEKLALSAAELVNARKLVHTSPTEAQKDAGNYRKGHITWQGLPIAIENPKGSTRSGVSKTGKKWSTLMKSDYGYFKQTEGHDGDPLDVFIGPELESELVHVINQVDPDTQKFDEHKVIIGAISEQQARETYLANYDKGWQGLGSIRQIALSDFKWWLEYCDTTKEIKHGYFSAPENRKLIKQASGLPEATFTEHTRTTYEAVCPHCHEEIGEKSLFMDKDDPENSWRHRGPCRDKGPFHITWKDPIEKIGEDEIPGYFAQIHFLKLAVDYSKRVQALYERADPDGLTWCCRCHELWEDCHCPGKEDAEKAALDPSYSPEHPEECCPNCGARQERGDDGQCNRCGQDWPE